MYKLPVTIIFIGLLTIFGFGQKSQSTNDKFRVSAYRLSESFKQGYLNGLNITFLNNSKKYIKKTKIRIILRDQSGNIIYSTIHNLTVDMHPSDVKPFLVKFGSDIYWGDPNDFYSFHGPYVAGTNYKVKRVDIIIIGK